jgi:precorrin-6B methylase 2
MASVALELEQFFRIMTINGASQLLAMDQQYRFLAACVEGTPTSDEIAQRCGTREKPTRLILEGLATLDLIEEEAGRFRLKALGKLLASSPQILGNRFWDHLPEYLKTGEPIIKMDALQHQAEHYQAEVGPLGWMLTPAAEEAVRILGIGDRRKGSRILDVGAGSAVWSLAMLRRDRSSTVTALDWPEVLTVAQHQAKAQQLEAQLRVLAGDFHTIQLPEKAFDIAVLANVTHLETPEQNRRLFRKVYQALDVSGMAVIIDVFPGIAEGDLTRLLYRLGLALRTEHGRVYSKEELSDQLREAGFISSELTLLQSPPHILGMVLAGK